MLLARYPPAPAPTDPYNESEIDLNRLTAHKKERYNGIVYFDFYLI